MKKHLVTAALISLVAVPALAAEMQILPQKSFVCELSMNNARVVVMDSALRFNWQVMDDSDGKMRLRYSKGSKFYADIEVVYTKKDFRVNYVESYGLGYERKGASAVIHRNYNRWIRNLDKEISLRSNAACLKK